MTVLGVVRGRSKRGKPRAAVRAELHAEIARSLRDRNAADMERRLAAGGIWCARVLTWDEMLASSSFGELDLITRIMTGDGRDMAFLGAPFRLDGRLPRPTAIAPRLNANGPRSGT